MDHTSKDLPLLPKRYLEKQNLYILPCLENLKIYSQHSNRSIWLHQCEGNAPSLVNLMSMFHKRMISRKIIYANHDKNLLLLILPVTGSRPESQQVRSQPKANSEPVQWFCSSLIKAIHDCELLLWLNFLVKQVDSFIEFLNPFCFDIREVIGEGNLSSVVFFHLPVIIWSTLHKLVIGEYELISYRDGL